MALSGLFSSVTPAANGIPMADGGGLIAQGWMFGVKPAHSIFAGPVSGADADPAFRALVAGDIPDLSSIYVPVTRQINTGTGLSGGGALSSDLTLAVTGNLATLFSLADGAGWLHNDGAGVLAYSTPTPSDIGLSAGNSITLTGGVIDTIQDIRTSAAPSFAGMDLGSGSFTSNGGLYQYAYGADSYLRLQSVGGAGLMWYITSRTGGQWTLSSQSQGRVYAASDTDHIFYSSSSEVGRFDANGLKVTGTIIVPGMPTSSSGLASGTLWNDSGTVKIA